MSLLTERPQRVTKTYVERRVRDWKRRVEALFRQVEAWAVAEWGEGCVVRGTEPQANEYWMKQTGVRPRELPTLEVRAPKGTVFFRPSCLWIWGANGRLDVRANGTHYMLCDHGGQAGRPSDWQITSPDPRVILEPFTRKAFLRLANAKARPED
jgi:hypothetical protein